MLWIVLWILASALTCWIFGRFVRVGMYELQPHAAVDTDRHQG